MRPGRILIRLRKCVGWFEYQTARMCKLIWIFEEASHPWLSKCVQRGRRSDCAFAQSDESSLGAHVQKDVSWRCGSIVFNQQHLMFKFRLAYLTKQHLTISILTLLSACCSNGYRCNVMDIYGPQRQKTYFGHVRPCAQSSLNLHWTHLDSWGCEVFTNAQQRLWSDWANVQANWSLRWRTCLKVIFSRCDSYKKSQSRRLESTH